MAATFQNIRVSIFGDKGEIKEQVAMVFDIEIQTQPVTCVRLTSGTNAITVSLNATTEVAKVEPVSLVLTTQPQSFLFKFSSSKDLTLFQEALLEVLNPKDRQSMFEQRTEASSAEQYFQFYGYLSQQQNMMQDFIRTYTYQRAILDNSADFKDKVVMDVGAGSGILSYFAVQAGAAKVYAVEASSMSQHCETIVRDNHLDDRIVVVKGKIEEIVIPENVDIIISEPMGYMLYNERMLETFLHAKKWLKPGGRMFPTQGDLHIAPFTDDMLYMEQFSKANFWYQTSFYGVDLSAIRQAAVKEYFKQPVVDTFDIRICLARSVKYTVDFESANETDLHDMNIPLSFVIHQAGTIHGLAFWFDVAFLGSQTPVWLSTAPTQPLTHWYQVRCLIENPIFVQQGQVLQGKVHLRANTRQSYDVDIELVLPATGAKSTNTLDLKNPFFRYTGQVAPAAATTTTAAAGTDVYWAQQDPNADQQMQENGYPAGAYINVNGDVAYVDDATQVVQVEPASPFQGNIVAGVNPAAVPVANTRSGPSGDGGVPVVLTQPSQAFVLGNYAVPGSGLFNNNSAAHS